MDAFNAEQAKSDPYAQLIKGVGFHTLVVSLREDHVRPVKPTLLLLQCGGLFLLLIGGVNLTNLLLVRASGRMKEVAVRRALGASGGSVARSVLAETTLLAVGGGLLGLLVGAMGIRLFATLGVNQLPLGAYVTLDGRVAVVTMALSLAVGVLLAGPILWFHSRTDLAQGLHSEGRSGDERPGGPALARNQRRAGGPRVCSPRGIGPGLGLSLKRVLDNPVGFRPENVLTGRIGLPWKGYKDGPSRLAFVERLLPAVRAMPGVAQVAINADLPFTGQGNDSAVPVEGRAPERGDTLRAHYIRSVSADYWAAMRIPLLRGRLLEDSDNHRTPTVCVVDRAFAERYWPGASPLGRRINTNRASLTQRRQRPSSGRSQSRRQKDLAEPGRPRDRLHTLFGVRRAVLLSRGALNPSVRGDRADDSGCDPPDRP